MEKKNCCGCESCRPKGTRCSLATMYTRPEGRLLRVLLLVLRHP